jgi:hypothetical protein
MARLLLTRERILVAVKMCLPAVAQEWMPSWVWYSGLEPSCHCFFRDMLSHSTSYSISGYLFNKVSIIKQLMA